jgi:hypothetical protein
MNTDTEYLKSMAEEIAGRLIANDTSLPDKHLITEANRLKKNIIDHLLQIDNFPMREIFYFNTLGKLIEICDILYGAADRVTADVKVLLDLLADVKRVVPSEVSPDLPLPRAFVALQCGRVTARLGLQSEVLRGQGIDPELVTIAMLPFRQFAHPVKKLYWRDFTWLRGYEEKLGTMDWETADCNSKTEALISVLLNCDFNDDRFFIYCKRYMLERTNRHGTKKRRLAEFGVCGKLILQDTLDGYPSYNYRRPNISSKLIEWIGLEVKALKENESFDDELYKIEFNLDIDSLALFWKYLMEHGITKMVGVDLYAKQIAATCSTKGKVEFKWQSMKSKFYGKASKYLRRIYDPFVKIVEAIKPFLKP